MKRSAPFVAEPVPEMLSGSAIDTAPTASVPPLDTVVVPEVLPRALVLPAVRIPPLTVIEPEYDELAPDNVSVPVPDFVKAPEPETTPETVAVAEEATWTVESDETVTAPEAVPEPEKYSAPADDTPVPDSVNGSAVVNAPTCNVAPLATVVVPVESPRALLLPTMNVPALTEIDPE